jgi:tetratricopeptide (TPR) repeat protein
VSSRRGLFFPESWPPAARAAVLIGALALVAYWPALSAPFISDDLPGIVRNSSIRQLSALGEVLRPAAAAANAVALAPIVNLSLALNYAAGGLDVRGYHLVNLFVHVATAVLLFGVLRRTFETAVLRERLGRGSEALALGIALVWALHPLQSESVAYVIQRAELLGGFFYLLTLATFMRTVTTRSRTWAAATVGACGLGMLTKEAMANVPLLLLLYDRAFVTGSFRAAWERRWPLYVALSTTWLLLAWWATYGAVSFGGWGRAMLAYAKLAFWPAPLVLDYGPAAIAEHRMYLPLAAIVALVAIALHVWAGRRAALALVCVATLVGTGLTWRRCQDYATTLRIWTDTVAKVPENARARVHLGDALSSAGRPEEAVAQYESALRLDPRSAPAHVHLAGVLLALGRLAGAVTHYESALQLQPGSAATHANLAAALLRLHRIDEAVAHYEAAAKHGMLVAEEQRRYGRALAEMGRVDESLVRLREALRLEPANAETHLLLGVVLSANSRGPEALRHFTEAVVLRPEDAAVRCALADALIESGRPAEAISHYEAALRRQPDDAVTIHASLAQALSLLGRVNEAISHYEEALRLKPDNAELRTNLERLRAAAARRGLIRN